ncbi:MAG: membrane protein insertase YidC [Chloroflexi bacterium]|nr:membrane protein insertase YidC [Chloroflexota bacterium]
MWDLLIINPMTNALLWLYGTLGNNFVLAIAVFTIITRIIMLPLNLRQQRSMARTQEMQPQIKSIQNKHKDNPQKMQEEFAKIGYNPTESLTGCLPMVATMPILFGLFAVLRIVLGTTPQALLELTQRAAPWIDLTVILPIDSQFLWMNLGQPDPYYVLPVLVFATMFLSTKISSPAKKKDDKKGKGKEKNGDDPTAAMTQSMQYTMPVMFGFFSLSFQAGLSIYFVLSNIIQIGQGYYTRRVMEREKVDREEQKNLEKMGMADNTDTTADTEKTAQVDNVSNGTAATKKPKSKSKKKKSKRKRKR